MNKYECLTASAAIVTAIATLLLAAFAFTAFRASVAQLKLLSADSARQTRPYVNIDFAEGLHGGGYWDIVIENVGRSIARDVRIDPGPLKPRGSDDHISKDLAKYFAHPLTLPPGARRRVMWRMAKDGKIAGADAEVVVEVSYVDDGDQSYADTFDIAPDRYGDVAPMPTEGGTVGSTGRTKSEESLANIERALHTLNSHVGMLRR